MFIVHLMLNGNIFGGNHLGGRPLHIKTEDNRLKHIRNSMNYCAHCQCRRPYHLKVKQTNVDAYFMSVSMYTKKIKKHSGGL